MSSAMTRRMIQRKFKMGGYTLKVEALNEVLSFISHFQDGEEEEAISILLGELQNESLKSSILDKEVLQRVVNLFLEANAAVEENPSCSSSAAGSKAALRIVDAFLIPKFHYDLVKKTFNEHTGKLPIHGNAPAKAILYRERFLLLSQQLSRNPLFTKPAFDMERSKFGSCEISPIQCLIGQTGKRWIMGLISQLEDGHFFLEDLTAAVEINLSNAKITTGFFSENTIVLAEGEMLVEGVFQVKTCGFPPLEDRDKTHALFSGLDFFGGGVFTKEETLRLRDMEMKATDDMIVILSDIWLDNVETMKNLATMLDGFENVEVVPSLFVFMGNFCSRPCNLSFNSYSSLRSQFGRFGQLIEAHSRLKEQSRFLFIPGPDDVGPSTVLPRCALPNYITEEFQKYVPNSVFSSNPCRIKYYTQEIAFFRQDMLYRMRRSCLVPPSTEETSEPFEHLVATIAHQSHLCPLPLSVQPVIWKYDHCLHLYPVPHTVVLADKSEQKEFSYAGTKYFNPGSFSNDSTFVAYRPCSNEVELCSL